MTKAIYLLLGIAALTNAADWRDQGIIDVDQSPYAKVHAVPVRAVTMGDGFWTARRKVVFERIIPGSDPPSGDAGRPEYHYILLDYICRPAGGKLHASDDASRAAWFTEGEIAGLKITEGTPAVIARAFAWLREADQPALDFVPHAGSDTKGICRREAGQRLRPARRRCTGPQPGRLAGRDEPLARLRAAIRFLWK